ncbi:MAG: aminoacyl-histidine dipeptidase [Blautia sp.]|nr:aminoacyl-histidine dipeptidase [Blautia sp.]
MGVLEGLKPERVFYYFEQICGIPHGSGNIGQISDYLVSFAKEHGLRYLQDEMKNVLICKEAAPGYENSAPVILQGHMDMVCEKRADVEHDFTKDGLKLHVEDGCVRAEGTTLGGDDGIAVAYALALLEDKSLPAPALECLFTVDEEIGLLGADGFDCSVLQGKTLINMDSEAEGILTVSCAGGMGAYTRLPVKREMVGGTLVEVRLHGLRGGHSGAEIHKNRGNANVLMGRFLYDLSQETGFALVTLHGGEKDNAITRECTCTFMVRDEKDAKTAEDLCRKLTEALRKEYANIDDGITFTCSVVSAAAEENALVPTSQEKVIFYLMNVPFGVRKMSGTIEGLVETSSNIGILKLGEKELLAVSSVRSSVGTAKEALSSTLRYLTEFLGGTYTVEGSYPAWEYRKESPLRDLMVRVFREQYGHEQRVEAIHAGLECGLFYDKIPGLDSVSIGPDMKNIHTSEETLDIASAERVYTYVRKVLEQMR